MEIKKTLNKFYSSIILYSIFWYYQLIRLKHFQLIKPPLIRPQHQRLLDGLGLRIVVAYQQPRALQRQPLLRVRARDGVAREVEDHQVAGVLGAAGVGPCAGVVGVETFVGAV